MAQKKFVLKKQGATFSDRQKTLIDYHIDRPQNWKNFKDLIDIKLVKDSIDDNSFIVSVNDTGTTWHNKFSIKLCKLATLDNLKVNERGELFNVIVL